MLDSVQDPVVWASDKALYGDVPSAIMEAVLYLVVMIYVIIGVIL